MNYYAGCFVVLLLAVLSAAGFTWILAKGLGWLAARGVDPGFVIFVAVFAFAAYSLIQANRSGRL